MGIGTFAITWSFFFTTPGVVKWSVSTDPIAWNLTGEFLHKDVVLLCVCVVLFFASLPKKVIPLRSNTASMTFSRGEKKSSSPLRAKVSGASGFLRQRQVLVEASPSLRGRSTNPIS
jgi:hypothetical protein